MEISEHNFRLKAARFLNFNFSVSGGLFWVHPEIPVDGNFRAQFPVEARTTFQQFLSQFLRSSGGPEIPALGISGSNNPIPGTFSEQLLLCIFGFDAYDILVIH